MYSIGNQIQHTENLVIDQTDCLATLSYSAVQTGLVRAEISQANERTQPSFWWLAHVDGVQYHAQGHSAMQPVDPGHRPLKLPISG